MKSIIRIYRSFKTLVNILKSKGFIKSLGGFKIHNSVYKVILSSPSKGYHELYVGNDIDFAKDVYIKGINNPNPSYNKETLSIRVSFNVRQDFTINI